MKRIALIALIVGLVFFGCDTGNDPNGNDPNGDEFVASTNETVSNDADTLGLVGTIVLSSNSNVATAEITTSAKIKITSVAEGTAVITVSDASSHNATINITVSKTGTITIAGIVKYQEQTSFPNIRTIQVTGAQVYLTDEHGSDLGQYTGNVTSISSETIPMSGSIVNGVLNLTIAVPSPQQIQAFKTSEMYLGWLGTSIIDPPGLEVFGNSPYGGEVFPVTEAASGNSLMLARFRDGEVGNGCHIIIYSTGTGTITMPNSSSFSVYEGWNFIEAPVGATLPDPLPNVIPGDNYKWYVISPSDEENPQLPDPPGTVFVSGMYGNGIRNIACYWKDGEKTDLELPTGAIDSLASKIAVSGGSVHIAGYYWDGNTTACYWKDGVLTKLSLPAGASRSVAYAIAVSGGSVYIAGIYYEDDNRIACYWKDGVIKDLELPTGVVESNATAIAVSGGSVYILGGYSDEDWNYCYWKDGVRIDLTLPNSAETGRSSAGAIAVLNGSVYIAGRYEYEDEDNATACYWKDGVRTDLAVPAGTVYSRTNEITVSGSSVYITGNYEDGDDNTIACYWKDGVKTDITLPISAETSVARGIAVSNGSVHIAGMYGYYDDNDEWNTIACYWKDGVITDLALPAEEKYMDIYSIAVTE